MRRQSGNSALKIITVLAFLAMVTVNILADVLLLNGVTTGEVSEEYPNLFAPAPYTFAIWGAIYLLLAGYTLYQAGLFGKQADAALLRRVNIFFILSSLANTAWVFAWHYNRIGLSVLLIAFILVCLIVIARTVNSRALTPWETLFIALPFNLYFGWITVATIANITTWLVSINWDGWGIAPQVWTVIVLFIGFIISSLVIFQNRSAAYGLAVVWGYIGIFVRHVLPVPKGFGGQYPGVVISAAACALLLLVLSGYAFATRLRVVVFRRRGTARTR